MKCVHVLLALLALIAVAHAEAPIKVAVFDFELIDTSLEGEVSGVQEAQTNRLRALTEQLREAVAAAPGTELIDVAPIARTSRSRNLQACGGCDRDFAERMGADWSITGTVQKVSNLILNINVYVREVESGERIQAMSADIRGNTDESWQRGLSYLIRNRLELPQ